MIRLALPALLGFLAAACAGPRPPLPVLQGSETPALRGRAQGVVLWSHRDVHAHDVRTGEDWLARSAEDHESDGRRAMRISGPDRGDRFAALEDVHRSVAGLHHVLTRRPVRGGEPAEVFEAPGQVDGERVAGAHLALSPDGRRIAFVRGSSTFRRSTGRLEVWDIATQTRLLTGPAAVGGEDGMLSWLPDGRHLAFCALVAPGDPRLAIVDPELAAFRDGLREKGGGVPWLILLDAGTGKHHMVHPGAMPVVATDGRTALVHGGHPYSWFGDWDGARPWRRVDLETGRSEPVTIPGDWRGVLGLDGDLVVYLGLPTAGAEERYTTNNSNFVGAKPMGTVKLADLRTGEFVTLVPYIDPRWRVAWGPAHPR